MTLMRVRRAAQLTLPVKIRRALQVKEGDYLEAEVVKNGALLKTGRGRGTEQGLEKN